MKKFVALALAFFLTFGLSPAAVAAISDPVRIASTTSSLTSAPLSVTTTVATGLNDLITVVSYSTSSRPIQGITDVSLNSYTVPTCYAVGVGRLCIAYAKSTTIVPAQAAAIEITYTNSASRIVQVFTTPGANIPADIGTSANGTTNTDTAPSNLTPTLPTANSVLFGATVVQADDTVTITPDAVNGWTSPTSNSRAGVGRLQVAWKKVASTAQVQRTEALSGGTAGTAVWMSNTFVFPEISGGPPVVGKGGLLTLGVGGQ